ncbi:hypothetical protein GTV15_20625, partial [Streptomyces sp. SID7803]|nr:hypothetical protein [Streptomyces sp. SID7803]
MYSATVAAIGHRVSAAVLFVGQSLFDLLTLVWRTGADPPLLLGTTA